jgi:hypothetical protein
VRGFGESKPFTREQHEYLLNRPKGGSMIRLNHGAVGETFLRREVPKNGAQPEPFEPGTEVELPIHWRLKPFVGKGIMFNDGFHWYSAEIVKIKRRTWMFWKKPGQRMLVVVVVSPQFGSAR